MTLANWYVPIVLLWRERLVNTTKPQNEADNGSNCLIDNLFGLNTSNQTQIWRPRNVMIKCINVSVILGNPWWI